MTRNHKAGFWGWDGGTSRGGQHGAPTAVTAAPARPPACHTCSSRVRGAGCFRRAPPLRSPRLRMERAVAAALWGSLGPDRRRADSWPHQQCDFRQRTGNSVPCSVTWGNRPLSGGPEAAVRWCPRLLPHSDRHSLSLPPPSSSFLCLQGAGQLKSSRFGRMSSATCRGARAPLSADRRLSALPTGQH